MLVDIPGRDMPLILHQLGNMGRFFRRAPRKHREPFPRAADLKALQPSMELSS
jgi:hypothetical protein